LEFGGRIMKVNPPVVPLGVVTVRNRIPVSVFGAMLTNTVIDVGESPDGIKTLWGLEMVIPGPLIASCVWPGTKLAPRMVTRTLEPVVAVFGNISVTIGGGDNTLNFCVPDDPTSVITMTSRASLEADESMTNFAVSDVESMTFKEFTDTPDPLTRMPVLPGTKLLPCNVTSTVFPTIPKFGVIPVKTGG